MLPRQKFFQDIFARERKQDGNGPIRAKLKYGVYLTALTSLECLLVGFFIITPVALLAYLPDLTLDGSIATISIFGLLLVVLLKFFNIAFEKTVVGVSAYLAVLVAVSPAIGKNNK